MKLLVEPVWALQVLPDDEDEDLHEFALSWYRFTPDSDWVEPTLKSSPRPAVWVRFGTVEHLARLQAGFPEARLGPSSKYTEALIFSENWQAAHSLRERILDALQEEDGMDEVIREDTLEDY